MTPHFSSAGFFAPDFYVLGGYLGEDNRNGARFAALDNPARVHRDMYTGVCTIHTVVCTRSAVGGRGPSCPMDLGGESGGHGRAVGATDRAAVGSVAGIGADLGAGLGAGAGERGARVSVIDSHVMRCCNAVDFGDVGRGLLGRLHAAGWGTVARACWGSVPADAAGAGDGCRNAEVRK